MMITTVHLDRHGYVMEVFHNTRSVQLDANKYAGTLMEVTGPIAPGMRWNGETFVSPPPRIPVEAVHAERDRRINLYFPEAFREQVTAFGGNNALKMSQYLSDLHKTAELMGLDPPRDFKEDVRWPTPPRMEDMPVAQRFHEFQSVSPVSPVSGQPINIHVAPVINTTPQASQAPTPLIVQTKSETVQPVEVDNFGLDVNDPLYLRKLALVRAIDEFHRRGRLPGDVIPAVTDAAVKATASRTVEDFQIHESRVNRLLEAA